MSSSTGHEFKRRRSEITPETSPRSVSPGALPTKDKLGDPCSPSADLSTSDVEEAITKRARRDRSPTSDTDADSKSRESYTSRRKRFLRTAEVCQVLDLDMLVMFCLHTPYLFIYYYLPIYLLFYTTCNILAYKSNVFVIPVLLNLFSILLLLFVHVSCQFSK